MQTKEELETIYKMWKMGVPIECRGNDPASAWFGVRPFNDKAPQTSKLRAYIELGDDTGVKKMLYRVVNH